MTAISGNVANSASQWQRGHLAIGLDAQITWPTPRGAQSGHVAT
jgi:hypothetical protein